MPKILTCASLVCLAIGADAVAQPKVRSDAASKPGQQGSQLPPVYVTVEPARPTEQDLKRLTDEREEDLALAQLQLQINESQLTFNQRLYYVTLAQALIGVGALGVAIWAAIAAKNSADAAKASAETASKDFQIEASAEITVKPPTMVHGATPVLIFALFNEGRVAATKLCASVSQHWEILIGDNKGASEHFKTDLMPAQSLNPLVAGYVRVELWSVLKPRLAGFNASANALTVSLRMSYENGFGESVTSTHSFYYTGHGFEAVPTYIEAATRASTPDRRPTEPLIGR